jgi:phage tail sheath protein FI
MRNSKMAFQVSPGVQVKEVDLTNVVPAVSTSIGGYAGSFVWGPVDKVVQVGSEKDLVAKFGRPDDTTAKSFLTAAQFLTYGSDLRVVRSNASGLLNATSATDSISSVTITNAGSGFTAVPLVAISASPSGDSADNASATATLKVVSASPNGTARGTSYAVGDVVTVNLGSGTEAVFSVATINDTGDGTGPVQTLSITTSGSYSGLASTDVTGLSTQTDSTAGSGLEVNVSYGVESVTIVDGGSSYDPNSLPTVSFTGGSDDGSVSASVTLAQSGILVKNEDHKDSVSLSSSGPWVARYPGALGNSLQVKVATTNSFSTLTAAEQEQFDTAPDAGECHILVIDEDGSWTGSAGSILESYAYLGTTAGDKKADGTNNYYQEVINRSSLYVWSANALTMPTVTASSTSLSGGVTSVAEEGQSVTSLTSAFEDAEQIDVNLLIGGDLSSANANLVIGIAAKRKDCVAFVSPPLNATVGNNSAASAVKTWADSVTSSSYGVMDSTAGYMYDKYNDVYRWVPASGSTAGLCANADSVADSWFSPAGLNRGQIRTFAKLAFNPKQVERDTLYKARVNPIVSFPGEGTVLFGDKTALAKPSAFDRINVRRLFITIEKAIATASKFSLFEFNDEFTRAQFLNLVEPFLRDVQGRRGITDFRVVCDETNNTGEVIDTNRFVSDIYIKPARSINFITLSFIATRTGVDFSEIVGG